MLSAQHESGSWNVLASASTCQVLPRGSEGYVELLSCQLLPYVSLSIACDLETLHHEGFSSPGKDANHQQWSNEGVGKLM